jgi:hypothetical protein
MDLPTAPKRLESFRWLARVPMPVHFFRFLLVG